MIFLNYLNSEITPKKRRLHGMWYSFIWFTSMEGALPIKLNDFSNCAFGLIFLVLRKDVRSLRLVITEYLEHYFRHICTWNSEFNTLDFTKFVKKLDKMLDAMFRSKVSSGCEQSTLYLSGFNRFRESFFEDDSKL